MRSLKKQMWAKVLAAVLCFAAMLCLIAELACTIFLCGFNAYGKTDEELMDEIYDNIAYGYALSRLESWAKHDPRIISEIEEKDAKDFDIVSYYSSVNADLLYNNSVCKVTVTRDDKKVVLSQEGTDGSALFDGSYRCSVFYYIYDGSEELAHTDEKRETFTVDITLIEPTSPLDLAGAAIKVCRLGLGLKVSIYPIILATVALILLLMVFLCSAAGHTTRDDEIHLRFPARVPLDLELVFVFVLLCFASMLFSWLAVEADPPWPIAVIDCLLTGTVFIVTAEWLPVSIAARVKAGKWWRNTLIYRCIAIIGRILRAIWRGLVAAFRAIPFIWRTAIFAFATLFAVFLFSVIPSMFTSPLLFILVLPADLAIFAVMFWYAVSVEKLRKSASDIAAGSIGDEIDTKYMPYELKCLGEELNRMGDGLTRAVEEKTKSERMKAELITNVSHDIKTPLTSIVNYVELLSRESLDGKAAEYVEVLTRQSQRMKKLIDDLVEASKASTGNITATLTPLDLSVMAGQTEGEYAERFAARELHLVVSGAEEPAIVKADGRLVWRIWDNLLGNICKYAMPGTRVYLNIERRPGVIATVFRNISEQPLCKSAEELTERFVRGDNSRSGDGSGLGLSIASGLAAVQGGTLSVKADGDLFKAEIILPAMPAATCTAEAEPVATTTSPMPEAPTVQTTAEQAPTDGQSVSVISYPTADGAAGKPTLPPDDGPSTSNSNNNNNII